jgi:hypothetical protein
MLLYSIAPIVQAGQYQQHWEVFQMVWTLDSQGNVIVATDDKDLQEQIKRAREEQP